MEPTITFTSIAAVLGVAFGIFSFLKTRDKYNSEKEREITELKIRIELYKEELDGLKERVDTLDTKLMEEVKTLGMKLDQVILKLIDKQAKEG